MIDELEELCDIENIEEQIEVPDPSLFKARKDDIYKLPSMVVPVMPDFLREYEMPILINYVLSAIIFLNEIIDYEFPPYKIQSLLKYLNVPNSYTSQMVSFLVKNKLAYVPSNKGVPVADKKIVQKYKMQLKKTLEFLKDEKIKIRNQDIFQLQD